MYYENANNNYHIQNVYDMSVTLYKLYHLIFPLILRSIITSTVHLRLVRDDLEASKSQSYNLTLILFYSKSSALHSATLPWI